MRSLPEFDALEPRVLMSSAGYLTPSQLREAYGFNQVYFTDNGSTVAATGAGEKIAIVDAYGDANITTDLEAFDAEFGLSNDDASGKFALTVDQPQGKPASNAGWAMETALDVEWAHVVAPDADIVLVEATSDSFASLMSAVTYAKSIPGVVAVSMSWGGNDFTGERAYDSTFTTPANHKDSNGNSGGVAFVAASGDDGAPSGYPATSPYVLAVGGTTLNTSDSGAYESETGWEYSGGGPSVIEGTQTPDVSYSADPNDGFPVYDSIRDQGEAGWWIVGGTSAGSPQWAGLIADADQGLALRGEGSLTSNQVINELYSLPESDFHDITTGNNGYAAGPGYDYVTGLGTPIAQDIIAGLVGDSVTTNSGGSPYSAGTGATPSVATTGNTAKETAQRNIRRHVPRKPPKPILNIVGSELASVDARHPQAAEDAAVSLSAWHDALLSELTA